ncbi:hypothetical protein [Halobacteriovorax sp.]|uniref:hypothetical protein n=1 Tax=Halobacteriovorax sp. TaxID=2020862 RepID=UPI003AF2FC54
MRKTQKILIQLKKYSKFEWLLVVLLIIFISYIKFSQPQSKARYPAGYPSQLNLKHDSNGEVFILN